MNKKAVLILSLLLLSILQLILIKPILAAFYEFDFIWKLTYIGIMYGFPVLLLLPTALIVLPFAYISKGSETLKKTWALFTQNTFLVVIIIVVFFNSLILFMKFVAKEEVFEHTKYADLPAYNGNTDDLRTGNFETSISKISRTKDIQIETSKNETDKTVFAISWLSDQEYILVSKDLKGYRSDTITVKVTNNTEDFYECYVKYGEYASYYKIDKIK